MIFRLQSHASLAVFAMFSLWALSAYGLEEPSPENSSGSDAPPINDMMRRPLFDDSLPGSLVSVRVVRKDLNTPAPEIPVSLALKTGSEELGDHPEDLPGFVVLSIQKTDAHGRVNFNAEEFAGRDAAIIIETENEKIVSEVVSIPRSGGVRFLFGTGLNTRDSPRDPSFERGGKEPDRTTRRDLSEISMGVEYRIRSVEDGNVWFSIYYSFVNPMEKEMELPREGIFIPHPENMENVQLMGNGENVRQEESSIRITGSLPRGEYQTVVSAMAAYKDGSLRIIHELPLYCRGILVSMPHYPSVTIVGPGLERIPVDVSGHADLRVYTAPGGPGPHRVFFSITRLPERSRWWAGLVVILAVFFLAAGLWERK